MEIEIKKNVFIFIFRKLPTVRNYFDTFGVFCNINCYFQYGIRILCLFLYIGRYFKGIFDIFEIFWKMTRSVNNFSTKNIFSKNVYTLVLSRRVPSSSSLSSSVCPSVPSSVVRRRRRPSSVRPSVPSPGYICILYSYTYILYCSFKIVSPPPN